MYHIIFIKRYLTGLSEEDAWLIGTAPRRRNGLKLGGLKDMSELSQLGLRDFFGVDDWICFALFNSSRPTKTPPKFSFLGRL